MKTIFQSVPGKENAMFIMIIVYLKDGRELMCDSCGKTWEQIEKEARETFGAENVDHIEYRKPRLWKNEYHPEYCE